MALAVGNPSRALGITVSQLYWDMWGGWHLPSFGRRAT